MLDDITTHLKTSHQAEIEFHAQKLKELYQQKENTHKKLNRLIDMTLNGLFTEEICKSKKAEIDKELKSIAVEIEMHDNADTHFKETLTTAFYLASKSYDLFICSKSDEKRRLINFVFSNFFLSGKTLVFTVVKPFDEVLKCAERPIWLRQTVITRTKRRKLMS